MINKYTDLLKSTNRIGIDNLIRYMTKDTDFFTAPASSSKHGSYEGGLVEHSLEVYDYLLKINRAFDVNCNADTVIIISLLHDLCKANFYKTSTRNVQDYNVQTCNSKGWSIVPYYSVDDKFPLGHGEKSVILAQRYIALTDDEMMAIRWHMGGFDDAARAYSGGFALTNAMDMYPLVTALHMADIALRLIPRACSNKKS
jgi:hypothetical protein